VRALLFAIALCGLPAAAQTLDPAYEKVALDATVLFDSGKSALRPAGRKTLDDFMRQLRGLETRTIVAVGYADRTGPAAANQILSEERVDAVKAYLVSRGIPPERVRTSAWGDRRPGMNLLGSLQADRQVFVEVSGTRLAQ
jgi:OOP family OmpA-OmpF porin